MKIVLLAMNLWIVSLFGQTGTIRWVSDTNQCLDAHPGLNDNIYLHPCHGGDNQKFTIGTRDADGYYDIICVYNNECLDAHPESNGQVDNSDNIYTHPCHDGDNQKWRVEGQIIRNKANNGYGCLDVGDSGNNAHIWGCNENNGNQKLLFIADSSIEIRAPAHSNYCLDKLLDSSDNVYLHPCHGGNNQKWKLGVADNDGYYALISENNFECLDANLENNNIVDNSDNIYTHPCHYGDNQLWKIDGNQIESKANGAGNYCVDGGDGGKNVHIWTCDRNNFNQLFIYPGLAASDYDVPDTLAQVGQIKLSSDNSRCVDVNYNTDPENIYLHPCHGGDNQKFRLGQVDDQGYYTLIDQYNNECIDVNRESNGLVDYSDNIITWPCHDGDNQKWRIEGGLIKSKANGAGSWCLDIGDSGNNAHIWACDVNNGNQRLDFISEESITIRNPYRGGYCLDKRLDNTDNVYLHPCHGGDNQKWQRGLPDNDGYYTIKSLNNDECLDAHLENNGIVDNSDNIYTHPCHDGDNQKWKIEGSQVKSKANGGNYCLDGGDWDNNAHIWSCDMNNVNQVFILNGVSYSSALSIGNFNMDDVINNVYNPDGSYNYYSYTFLSIIAVLLFINLICCSICFCIKRDNNNNNTGKKGYRVVKFDSESDV